MIFLDHYAGKYTIFGQVIDGMEVLDKMEKAPVGEASIRVALALVASCQRLCS